jgi:NitT/TauT family transport system substrate-binding protein
MQFDQQTATRRASHDAYWQQLDADIELLKKRTRRQFLTTAGGVIGGTAALLGGMAVASNPGLFHFPRTTTCVNGSQAFAGQIDETLGAMSGDLTTLKVCQLNTSINFFPIYVAQQKGYFVAQGLNIPKPPLLQVGPKLVAALESGQYDLANGVITDAFTWARVSSEARIIGAVLNGYIVDVVVSNQFEQEMQVSASSPLADKINALRGKRIGITGPGTGTQALLIYLFRQQGMDASKETIQVSLGSNNKLALTALREGSVDALSFFSPIGQTAEAQGIGDILISPVRGDIPGLKGDVHGVIYTKQSTIDTKQQAILAYIRALNQAELFIKNNPVEARQLLNGYLGLGQGISNAVYTATAPVVATSPVITQASYNVAGQFHVKAGLVSLIPSYNQLVATGTINAALFGSSAAPCPS